ncbi:MAG TPA: DUF433 domain-containing protein [Phycisphaerae bacterium]|nr:DUF433 domain-containing protein [Phycisphaerae bacterium]
MTLTPVKETHIYLDEKGEAWVKRAGAKVRELVEIYYAYGEDPEEIVRQFPHLTLSDVHAAMMHYYDHRAEIDETIKRLRELTEKMQAETPEAPITKQLRESGKLPGYGQ